MSSATKPRRWRLSGGVGFLLGAVARVMGGKVGPEEETMLADIVKH